MLTVVTCEGCGVDIEAFRVSRFCRLDVCFDMTSGKVNRNEFRLGSAEIRSFKSDLQIIYLKCKTANLHRMISSLNRDEMLTLMNGGIKIYLCKVSAFYIITLNIIKRAGISSRH